MNHIEFDPSSVDTKTKPFQEALNLVKYTNHSLFLTGKAGTGKSTFLKYLASTTHKKLVILAPTGIAAINAGGATLHSFFNLPFFPLLPDDPNLSSRGGRIHKMFKYDSDKRYVLKELDLIIIDEISMVRADTLDAIDAILRVYGGNRRLPFGGKQLLFIGDVYQLEPVVKRDEANMISQYYETPHFFSARVFQRLDLVCIELAKVYRQKDPKFIFLLDSVRENKVTQAQLDLLNSRYSLDKPKNNGQYLSITLASRRKSVDYINENELAQLPGNARILKGEIDGDFPESSLPTQMELQVKVGAQVVFVKNDQQKRWVNGTLGIISAIDETTGVIEVTSDNGNFFDIEPVYWYNNRYSYNKIKKEIEETVLGVFKQYPIKLAWAITIHKSQGLTFAQVTIDLGGGAFAPGMTYVALSRCTSLEGITMSSRLNRSDVIVRPEVLRFAQRFNNRESIDNAMQDAKADLYYKDAAEKFTLGEFGPSLDSLFSAMHLRYDIETPIVKRFFRKKLGTINLLKKEISVLKQREQDRNKKLKRFAHQFVVMGDECLVHDLEDAAMANYNKAIELCPDYKVAWRRISQLEKKVKVNKK
ncbi:MAG: AAA family ATPase [Bacteroidaceae bacterium]